MDLITDRGNGNREIMTAEANANNTWREPAPKTQRYSTDSLEMLSWDGTYKTFLSLIPNRPVVWVDPLSPQVNVCIKRGYYRGDDQYLDCYIYNSFFYFIDDPTPVDIPFSMVYDKDFILLYMENPGPHLDRGLVLTEDDNHNDDKYSFGPILTITRTSKKDVPLTIRKKMNKAVGRLNFGPYQ